MDSNLILLEWIISYFIEKEIVYLKAVLVVARVFEGSIITGDTGDEQQQT